MKGAQQATAHELCLVKTLLTHQSHWTNLHSTGGDDDCGSSQAVDKRRHDHGDRENAMADHPHVHQTWLVFVKIRNEGRYTLRWTRREPGLCFIFRALDEERQYHAHYESNDGKCDEGHGADAPNFPREVSVSVHLCFGGCIVAEVDFPNPCCRIEEKRKPSCLLSA